MSDRSSNTELGMVGVGRLGLAMALNLLARGHRVVGYRRGSMDELIEAGGEAAKTPAELADRANIIFICLPDEVALGSVLNGADGLLATVSPGVQVFDLGTYDMAAKNVAREKLSDIGVDYFDCAVSGNPGFVAARSASIFVSGHESAFVPHRDVLADITDNVTFAGAFGAGTALKLIVSALIPVHTLAAAEAMSLASRAGIDRQLLYDAIAGTPASSGMFETRGKSMVDGTYAANVTLNGYLKNITMALDLAEQISGEYPLLTRMHDVFRDAADAGFGSMDQSAVFDYLMGKKPES